VIPVWIHAVAILALLLGFAIAFWIARDEFRQPQHMWIMNVVWPVTALFGTALTLWAYRRYGRLATRARMEQAEREGSTPPSAAIPFAAKVAKGALHCGSGCTLGDIIAEWLAYLAPAVAVCFGWKSLFAEKMFAVWAIDYVFAFGIGILFQYYTIKPMRGLSPGEGLAQAVKADALSLTAWQIGMYGFMAIAQFLLFRRELGIPLQVASFEFWFMMQIAMLAGFATSYPVNWWLVRRGIKEAM
jgi:hypothetical protein